MFFVDNYKFSFYDLQTFIRGNIKPNTIYNNFVIYLRNNSWKPYVYIVFTTGLDSKRLKDVILE